MLLNELAAYALERLPGGGYRYYKPHRPKVVYVQPQPVYQAPPLNPVASFHIGNGAQLIPRNVHFAANRTERGLADSCGFMVSYIYSSTWFSALRRTARAMLPWEI